MILNTELKSRREERRLTQEAIAQQCGITLRAYQYIELNGRIPRADTAILIARALNSTVEELFGSATPANTKEPDGNQADV